MLSRLLFRLPQQTRTVPFFVTSSIATRPRHLLAHRTPLSTRADTALTADPSPPAVAVPFDESETVVTLDGASAEDGGSFTCDEEPHMVPVTVGGGYIPLHLGQRLKSTISGTEYDVLRKLGWGADSSVWLAHSETKGYTAIKILTCAASSRTFEHQSYELEVLKRLRGAIRAGTAPKGSSFCTSALEVFSVQSVHGGHFCFVFPPHSASLDRFMRDLGAIPFKGFPLSVIKNIGQQVLLALSCLHSLGVVHTDVKGSNVFMCVDDNEQQAIADFMRENPSTTYEPRSEPSLSPDPIITVRSEPLPPFGFKGFEKMRVCLGDYGEAIPVEKTAERPLAMPTALRAPEIILGHPWGLATDIWAFGCLLLELITRRMGRIFDLDAGPGMTFTDVHLARTQELLGPFPPAFLSNCSHRERFFHLDGHLLQSLGELKQYGALCEQLSRAGLAGVELKQTEAFLRRCLSIDPNTRASALELSQDDWFKNVPSV